ncbi:MAG: IS701 family transposase, partial [Actinobacteria bacterium]|nr:IS701 family transposase [Actinomycetota bacterium]
MTVVEAAGVDSPAAIKERLEGFGREVLVEAMNRPVQVRNGSFYLRGLIEQGPRKSLEPMVARLSEESDYQSMQQFLADSPWDPALVVKAVAERVAPEIEVEAWVLDDTGFPKDGVRSPGVKRQYSGTLGKIGNCQIGVSVHAVGAKGTAPLGWALYLPEEWCEDRERRRRAKIPAEVAFKTKPELGVGLCERAAGWEVPKAPVLGDAAYGDNTELRERLHAAGHEYVLSVAPETTVFEPRTTFAVPERTGSRGRPPKRAVPDRDPVAIGELARQLGPERWQTIAFRDGPDGQPATSRFAFVRVRAANAKAYGEGGDPPREEWL